MGTVMLGIRRGIDLSVLVGGAEGDDSVSCGGYNFDHTVAERTHALPAVLSMALQTNPAYRCLPCPAVMFLRRACSAP